MSEQDEEQKQKGREKMVEVLENLAKEIRSGETEVTWAEQEWPITRYWANGKWEYFRLSDLSMSLKYHDVARLKEEQQRLEKFLQENPQAECHGVGGLLGREG